MKLMFVIIDFLDLMFFINHFTAITVIYSYLSINAFFLINFSYYFNMDLKNSSDKY